MIEITRTIHQWRATAHRLDRRDPGYPEAAQRIHRMIAVKRSPSPDAPLTVGFSAEEAAVVLARAPLSAWWMPVPAIAVLRPVDRAITQAEEIIRAIGGVSLNPSQFGGAARQA